VRFCTNFGDKNGDAIDCVPSHGWKSACKPGSVEDNHSSGLKVTFQSQATNPKTTRATS